MAVAAMAKVTVATAAEATEMAVAAEALAATPAVADWEEVRLR